MTKHTFFRKLISTIFLLLVSLNVWSNDYVFIGTYTNDRDGKDYDIILEYDGEKFINLEINVRGDEDSQFCAWEIKGENRIQAFYSCLLSVFAGYMPLDDEAKKVNRDNYHQEIRVDWPDFKLQGRHFGKTSDYEMENLIDDASVQTYYIVKDKVRQLMILAILIDNYGNSPLRSALNFTSPTSLANFIQLVDPKFLSERIKLKEEMMKKER